MSRDSFPLLLLLLGFLRTSTTADVAVSCDLGASCVLPCSFQAGSEVVIHWIQAATPDLQVHSYYYDKDQLELQHANFSGRTSLFTEQLARGNASLRLAAVAVRDQGRYKCYCSTVITNKDSFIDLNVNAPVQKVDMDLTERFVTCSSEGIYPQPELTWSTEPNVGDKQETTIRQNEGQLYEVRSFLPLAPGGYESVSCTVETRRNKKKVTYLKERPVGVSGTEVTLQCGVALTAQTSLVWRFNRSRVVLTQRAAGDPAEVWEEWRPYVKNDSEPGSLEIKAFSASLQGVYTCEVSNDEETRINSFDLSEEPSAESSRHTTAIALAVVAVLLAAAGVVFFIWKKRKGNGKQEPPASDNEEENLSLNRT